MGKLEFWDTLGRCSDLERSVQGYQTKIKSIPLNPCISNFSYESSASDYPNFYAEQCLFAPARSCWSVREFSFDARISFGIFPREFFKVR